MYSQPETSSPPTQLDPEATAVHLSSTTPQTLPMQNDSNHSEQRTTYKTYLEYLRDAQNLFWYTDFEPYLNIDQHRKPNVGRKTEVRIVDVLENGKVHVSEQYLSYECHQDFENAEQAC